MSGPFSYRAFGLRILSDCEHPELLTATFDKPDLRIRLVDTKYDFPAPDAPGLFEFGDDGSFLVYPQVGAFRLVGTDTIEMEPLPGVDPGLLSFPLLGPLMGLLLQARGALVLHGSALEVEGKGVSFMGDKGAGKSTTASAFVRAGYSLLTDDILAIKGLGTDSPCILPAFPQVKLTHEASQALALPQARSRKAVPIVVNKERFLLDSGYTQNPISPARFYLLKRGNEMRVEPLDSQVRMKAFLRFSYVTRFGARAMSRAAAEQHVRNCAALAERSSVAILTVPENLAELDSIVEAVRQDGMTHVLPA